MLNEDEVNRQEEIWREQVALMRSLIGKRITAAEQGVVRPGQIGVMLRLDDGKVLHITGEEGASVSMDVDDAMRFR